MQVSVRRSDVIWSYLGTFFSLCSNLITVPLVVYFLDPEMLGLWYVFVSVGAIAILFDFGFTVTFARNITYCWSGAKRVLAEGVEFSSGEQGPDFALMKRILFTCKTVYLVISLSALVLMLTVGSVYIDHISTGELHGTTHITAWLIYSVGTFLNLYFNYYDSFLRGVGAVDIAQKNHVIARIIHLSLMTVLLFCGMGIVGASIAYLAYGLSFRLLGKARFNAYQGIGDKLKAVDSKPSREEKIQLFKAIWHNAWRDGAIHVATYCCDSLSVSICPLYLSLAETGEYSLALQIAGAVAAMSSVLHITYQPSIQAGYVAKDYDKLRRSLSIILYVYIGSFILGTLAAVFLGIPVLRFIKPEIEITAPLLLGVCLNQFLLMYIKCYTYYLSSTNRLIYMPAFLISAVACVALSFLFIGPLHMGIRGLILAQVGVQLCYNAWHWSRMVHKELDMTIPGMMRIAWDNVRRGRI